jgi:hypothetical protein
LKQCATHAPVFSSVEASTRSWRDWSITRSTVPGKTGRATPGGRSKRVEANDVLTSTSGLFKRHARGKRWHDAERERNADVGPNGRYGALMASSIKASAEDPADNRANNDSRRPCLRAGGATNGRARPNRYYPSPELGTSYGFQLGVRKFSHLIHDFPFVVDCCRFGSQLPKC